MRTVIAAACVALALPHIASAQPPVPAPLFHSPGAHFTVLFEGAQDYELARRALDILEQGYLQVGMGLNTWPDRNVPVVLYTEQQFRDITRAPDWAAAAYDGTIRVPLRGALAQPAELTRVLVHELTHAMLHSAAPRGLPQWLNEGIAVNFEPHGVEWAEAELATGRRPLPFDTLARSFRRLSGDAARMAYAQSAVVVHRMMQESGGTTLNAVLQDLNAGTSFDAAFEHRFFMPFDTYAASLASGR